MGLLIMLVALLLAWVFSTLVAAGVARLCGLTVARNHVGLWLSVDFGERVWGVRLAYALARPLALTLASGLFVVAALAIDGVVAYSERAVVEQAVTGAPADRAGLQPGDVIVSVDGHEVAHDGVSAAIGASTRAEVAIVVRRDGREHTFKVVPEDSGGRRMVGIRLGREQTRRTATVAELAVGLAFPFAVDAELLALFRPRTVAFSGPVGIVQQAPAPARGLWARGLVYAARLCAVARLLLLLAVPFFLVRRRRAAG